LKKGELGGLKKKKELGWMYLLYLDFTIGHGRIKERRVFPRPSTYPSSHVCDLPKSSLA